MRNCISDVFLCPDSRAIMNDFDFTSFLVGDLKEEVGEGKSDSISRTLTPSLSPWRGKQRDGLWYEGRRREGAKVEKGKTRWIP